MTPQPSTIWLALEPMDMRLGIDGLSLRVQQALGNNPCNGNAYAFRNKRGNRLKMLVWDGTGVWLSQRRLHRGRFIWPQGEDTTFTLSQGDWQWLTAGVDWRRLSAPPPAHLQA